MDLTDISFLQKISANLKIRPTRGNGQNFLINKNILLEIIKSGELTGTDTVLEIGPGFGVLTQELVKYAGRVVAVESDNKLAAWLSANKAQITNNRNNLEIINDDILKFSISNFLASTAGGQSPINEYKIIANLPYQITSPVLWRFLNEEKNKPKLILVMVQKEVGERICSAPGQMSIMSVMCQFYAECQSMAMVDKNSFWPEPAIDSMIVKFVITNPFQNRKINELDFFRLVKIGFSAKRKMLKNNLSAGFKIMPATVASWLKGVGLSEKIRAQELSVFDWLKIFDRIGKISYN